MINTKELRQLAQAATPHVGHACKYQDAHWLREGHVDFENADLFIASERPQEDAAFYAASNPATVIELLDRLEAAEKERDALRAELDALKRQEPYAFAVNFPESSRVELVHDLDEAYEDMIYEAYEVRKLYLAPGAQPAPIVPDDWMQHAARMAALARKLREPDWHFESIREMQRELYALEEAALAAAPEAKT